MAYRLRPGIQIKQKEDLTYQLDEAGRPIRFQPWLGNAFTFLYDFFMTHSVFPKQFNADLERHATILSEELQDVHGQQVLELGTGNGAASEYLPPDNTYIGSDISIGLLKKAVKRFRRAGFQDPEFYIASGDDLPFAGASFDLCLCILSLNFIGNHQTVFKIVHALLRPGGVFLVSVPVPERIPQETTIHGDLRSTVRLHQLCLQIGFNFEPIDGKNGALLYFRACKSEK